MAGRVKLSDAQVECLTRAVRVDGAWTPYASLFTVARNLNRKKLLVFKGTNEAGRPTYKITPAGRAALKEGNAS